jgi:hypothetical protein
VSPDSDEAAIQKHRQQARRAAAGLRAAMDDVIEGVVPDVEHLPDVDVVVIDNPLDHSARPGKAPALVSLRHDPVGRMAKRKQITEVQLRAARRWQALCEHSEIGGARAIDYGREHVDGGRIYDAFNEGRLGAADVIKHIDRRLGYEGAVLVRRVLVEKLELSAVAQATGAERRADAEYVGRRFRECLDTIARFFGYGEQARGKGRTALADEAAVAKHASTMNSVPQASARENRERARGHEWNWQPKGGT